ncbi:penicillin-insensitive murein endopeptidase [Streptomyces acidicola]|uniref:penicillin-insensitive murein endopeptidase n=1 Tax=Streptomyces acidicola TaxID=2596892 RepID=UPI0034459533
MTKPRSSGPRHRGSWTVIFFALIAALLLPGATPAHAFAGAAFHTQSSGNRGSDVAALQHLLGARGHTVATDGVFGSGTTAAVKAFQSAQGLTSDGIVGPNTWGRLVVTVQQNDSGPAVKAVQSLLNAKRSAGLAVDGVFGAGTATAVRNFQSHAGITADGVVGPETWRNLVWHYELINFSATMCDQNPDGNTAANWATASSVAQLEAAATSFASTGNGKVPVGDAGWEHGGPIPGHASHQVGVDIDIWPIRTDSAQCTAGRITWQSATYDRAATRQLVQAIRAAAPGHVALIFFNDPQLIAEGLTTQYANHDNHLHVRYV